jgi:hypothetical protein
MERGNNVIFDDVSCFCVRLETMIINWRKGGKGGLVQHRSSREGGGFGFDTMSFPLLCSLHYRDENIMFRLAV